MHNQNHPIVNIVVDVHDPRPAGIEKIDAASRAGFTAAIQQAVGMLRHLGIPSLFLAVGEESRLYPRLVPWDFSAPEVRNHEQLQGLRLSNVGPRTDEDIFVKRFRGGFTDIQDAKANPALAAYLAEDGKGGYDFMHAHYGRPTLAEHLHTLGVRQVTHMGAVADMCVLDTAIGASQKGFKSLIFPDLVVGFADENYSKITWPKTPGHSNEVRSALDTVIQNPSSRGLHAGDVTAVKSVEVCAFTDFVATLNKEQRPGSRGVKARFPAASAT